MLNIEDGIAKGSARSIDAINIFDALDSHRDLFVAFGGHAGAAGMTLEADKLVELADILTAYILDNDLDLTGKTALYLDEELHLPELTLDTLKSFERLAPFGMDNKKPLFYLKDFKVDNARTMGAGNSHLKLKISQEAAAFEVVAFGQGNLATEFAQTKNLELAEIGRAHV